MDAVVRTHGLRSFLSIKLRSLMMFEQETRASLATKAASNEERAKLEKFTASRRWTPNFVERNNMRSVSLHGEVGSIDDGAIATGMEEVRKSCKKNGSECIFNANETGVFFRVLPKRSYLVAGENRKTARGVKDMTAKNRMTAYICSNATGTWKIPFSLIDVVEESRCFRLCCPPVVYFNQRNAWSDTGVFHLWLQGFSRLCASLRTKKYSFLWATIATTRIWWIPGSR